MDRELLDNRLQMYSAQVSKKKIMKTYCKPVFKIVSVLIWDMGIINVSDNTDSHILTVLSLFHKCICNSAWSCTCFSCTIKVRLFRKWVGSFQCNHSSILVINFSQVYKCLLDDIIKYIETWRSFHVPITVHNKVSLSKESWYMNFVFPVFLL